MSFITVMSAAQRARTIYSSVAQPLSALETASPASAGHTITTPAYKFAAAYIGLATTHILRATIAATLSQ